MSGMVPLLALSKAKGNNIDGSSLAMLVGAPIVLAGMAINTADNVKDYIKAKVQTAKNKNEYNKIAEEYRKFSEGKVGMVESFTEGNTTTTVIHTEHGPFIREESSGSVVKVGSSMVQGASATYSGIREVTDTEGNKFFAFLDGVALAEADPASPQHSEETIIRLRTEGEILTESGKKIDCENNHYIKENEPYPTDGTFALVSSIDNQFDMELAKAQRELGDNDLESGMSDGM